MVKVGDPVGPLAQAQALAALGLRVLPARYKDKAPIVKWREYQNTSTDRLLPQWFNGQKQRNFWVMTGQQSKIIVIDCDNPAADVWWRKHLGDEVIDSAARVATRKGSHYWFRIPDDYDKPVASWSIHPDDDDAFEESFDVRADGTGVIAPPSVHETGHVYKWERTLDEAAYAPGELLDGSLRAMAPTSRSGSGEGSAKGTGGVTRSMLSSLLAKPPQGDGSGRNDWLARVAGHYAKTYHNHEDLYRTHCEAANALIHPPLEDEEFEKTISSIWRGEHERNSNRAIDADCGWLQSGGTNILTQVVVKSPDGETRTYSLEEYANFDLQAKGVMLADDQSRTYWVRIVRKARGGGIDEIDSVLPGHVLGDDRALRKWLASFACTIVPPDNMWPKSGSTGVRVQRYLESQQPASVKVTSVLGWDQEILDGKGGFVTHDGVITPEELFGCEEVGVRPNPVLLTGGMAPHVYGFEHDAAEARRVLEEVLSFHDEKVTAVFGAWWAACLLKPQIEERTSLFPFMAVEAPSESGKTNGFFDLMTQLNGNTRGETQPTKAALRDIAAAHRNGIVWVDDLDDPAYLMELLRAATSGGTLTKMGEDRESVKNTQIVAPIVISGEALGLGTQKALLDRAIIVKVGSPTGRRSRHNPDRPQWDDVLTLREQYPGGLSAVAGWVIQEALGATADVLAAIKEGRQGLSGRNADKLAILRAGARLLDFLISPGYPDDRAFAWTGRGPNALRVEDWIVDQSAAGIASNENTLTLQVLPWALRTFNYPEKPFAGERADDLDMPVFVKNKDRALARTIQKALGEPVTHEDDVEIWFSTALLAQAFEREHRGRVERRTQTEGALKDQADGVVKHPAKRYKITGGGGRTAYYRMINGELARRVLERAEGK